MPALLSEKQRRFTLGSWRSGDTSENEVWEGSPVLEHEAVSASIEVVHVIPSSTCSFTIKGNPWLPISVAWQQPLSSSPVRILQPSWPAPISLSPEAPRRMAPTMITYAADSHTRYGQLYFLPAGDHPEGTFVDIRDYGSGEFLGKVKQVPHTFSVVGFTNEHQLSMGETTFGGRPEAGGHAGRDRLREPDVSCAATLPDGA